MYATRRTSCGTRDERDVAGEGRVTKIVKSVVRLVERIKFVWESSVSSKKRTRKSGADPS